VRTTASSESPVASRFPAAIRARSCALLVLFTGELHAHGGPRLDLTQIRLHLDFYAAKMGLAVLIQAPALVLSRLPEAANACGPLDPVFNKNEVARGFLHVSQPP
jgi:hypothetical protein